MNGCLSDEIRAFRSLFDGYEHGGVKIDGRGVSVIQAKFNTLLALAGELEEERSRTQWNRLGEPLDPATAGDNVVMFLPAADREGGAL